ncbi:MAG: hypothetical protein JW751_17225 [Polyangiaceae bacterium]|nr:hypothetical protein [Polyangiaceae bacterium]
MPPTATASPTPAVWRPPAEQEEEPSRPYGGTNSVPPVSPSTIPDIALGVAKRLIPTWIAAAAGVVGLVFGLIVPRCGSAPPTRSAASAVPSTARPDGADPAADEGGATTGNLTLEQRAALGEEDARASLNGIPTNELTVTQSIAMARGDVAARLAELKALGERLKEEPTLADQPETLRKLLGFARDPHTTFRAQELIAVQQRPTTTDLLFEVWTGVPGRNPTTVLAERLVTSAAVRKHASPALAVALELRDVQDCNAAAELVARATEVGDRRALRSLQRLANKRDCGPDGRDDCYPCLRDPKQRRALGTALTTVQKRNPPSF